jgi:hypothetical protein
MQAVKRLIKLVLRDDTNCIIFCIAPTDCICMNKWVCLGGGQTQMLRLACSCHVVVIGTGTASSPAVALVSLYVVT